MYLRVGCCPAYRPMTRGFIPLLWTKALMPLLFFVFASLTAMAQQDEYFSTGNGDGSPGDHFGNGTCAISNAGNHHQFGEVALFNRRIKSVHINMYDFACFHDTKIAFVIEFQTFSKKIGCISNGRFVLFMYFCLKIPMKMAKFGYIYIMTHKHKTVLYIGVTHHLVRRIYEHNNHLIKNSFRICQNITCL